MKIVISAEGRGIERNIDASFHRCSFFLILDIEKNTLIALENTTKESPSEIGATVGQIISNQGIDAVIASDIGPTAFEIFERYGIKVCHGDGIIEDAVKQFKYGRLPDITKAAIQRYTSLKQSKMKKEN
jgi:predicted Fe-Mo cluster-binding NifX family protein